MPSNSLLHWQTNRLARVSAVDAQCAATAALVPANPDLEDENLRGYTMLLSAHWQGYCRDLHSECIQAVASGLTAPMQLLVQLQCAAARQLDGANPTYQTIRSDFERFGLNLESAFNQNPANAPRVTLLGHLNGWRNWAAHHKTALPRDGGPFALATVRLWRATCDELATELDRIMYNHLQAVTGAAPW